MLDTKITKRHEFSGLDDGSEEVTVFVHENDRLHVQLSNGASLTVQIESPNEISILNGSWTIYGVRG